MGCKVEYISTVQVGFRVKVKFGKVQVGFREKVYKNYLFFRFKNGEENPPTSFIWEDQEILLGEKKLFLPSF